MKLVQPLKAMLINVKEEKYTRKNGQEGTLRKVSLDQDGECGTLSCTEEVFDILIKKERFSEVVFMTEYSDQYSPATYRVIGVYEE